jgi:hypothetical protein
MLTDGVQREHPATPVVSVRPGPGGGIFAAAQTAMVRLGNSVLALDAGCRPTSSSGSTCTRRSWTPSMPATGRRRYA